MGLEQAAGPERPGVQYAELQGGGGVDVPDEVLGEQVGGTLDPHETLPSVHHPGVGVRHPGAALGAGALTRQAVERAAGQPDVGQGGGDLLRQQGLARPHRTLQ